MSQLSCDITPFYNFSLKKYFDESTIKIHYLLIPFMLEKYQRSSEINNYLIITCLYCEYSFLVYFLIIHKNINLLIR